MSTTEFSLETKSPFMQYAYTEDSQRMMAIDLLVQSVDKHKFHINPTKCGRFLHIQNIVPDIFLDTMRQSKAEEGNYRYHKNSSKAVVFNALVEKIETKIDWKDDYFGPPQIIKLFKACDPNVDVVYETIY